MNWYLPIKFLHVLAVIVCVGGLFARQLVRQHAKKMTDVRLFAAYSHAARRIESVMVIPGMMAILVLGIILALLGHFPLFGFLEGASQNWLLAANLLMIGILAIIPTVLVPRSRKSETILRAALAKGEITSELRIAMADRTVALAHLYEELALPIIVALMVLKPF